MVLLGGGGLAAVKLWPDATAAGPTPTSALTVSSAPTSAAAPSPAASSARPTPTSTPDSEAAEAALVGCQFKVRAADKVLEQARTGVLHWATHVQAQTDANSSKITVTAMKGKFTKTRLAGPADQKRYADALSAYSKLDGSCNSVKGADSATDDALADCKDRAEDQKPVLAAAANGMKDWRTHLAAMQRSKEGHVDDAQGVWIAAWRAAPPHINAYKKAAKDFEDAPSC
ncbi:MAG TPA: hypothetical protein VIT20_01105 [Propionibacteriaceae bacterium]